MDNQQNSNVNQIDLILLLRDMIRGAQKFWWVLLITVLCCAVACLGIQYAKYEPMYQCKASFTVSMEGSYESGYDYLFYYDRSTAAQMASTFPYILESELLTDLVKQDLDIDTINGTITASAIDNSNLFTLSVVSNQPQDAKNILDSVIRNYPTVSQYVIGHTQLNMIEAARMPDEPYNRISNQRTITIGIMLGIMIWLGILMLYALFRETIHSEEQIRTKLNAVSLGSIPFVQLKQRKSKTNQDISLRNKRVPEGFSEAIRKISLRLSKIMQEKEGKVIAVAGISAGEGCSMTALNLAYAFAETGQKVLLVRQEKETDSVTYAAVGLSEKESALGNLADKNGISIVSVPNKFRNIPHGKQKTDIEAYLSDYRAEYDLILIDAGLGSVISESAAAIQTADVFLLTVRQDTTAAAKISNCIGQLLEYDTEFAGCILNAVSGSMLGYGYGKYGSYRYASYGYGRYGKSYGYGKRYGYGAPQQVDSDVNNND